MPPGDAARRSEDGRRRGALLLPDGSPPSADEGRLAAVHLARRVRELRARLDALGRRLGGSYRVLVDENAHVDRAAAVRAGVAFYGKNTMAITRRHGSWVVLGALVTDVEIDTTPALELDCGECRLCIDACPTGALDEPGTLDATKCLSYWTQAPAAIPEEYRAELGAMVYGCDVCQDVCPWNRGIEKRRRGHDPANGADGRVSLADWLDATATSSSPSSTALYVPRKRCSLAAAQRADRRRERRHRALEPVVRATTPTQIRSSATARMGSRADRGSRR